MYFVAWAFGPAFYVASRRWRESVAGDVERYRISLQDIVRRLGFAEYADDQLFTL